MPRSSRKDLTKKRGTPRMKEFGYKKVEVWFDAREIAAIEEMVRQQKKVERMAPLLRRLACEWAGIQFNAH